MSSRRHRCPHNVSEEHLELPHEPLTGVTSYRSEYDEKHVDRRVKYYHEDNLHPEGEIDTVTTSELVFTGKPGERPTPHRRNTYTKVEGDFTDETTTRTEFVDHRSVKKVDIIRRTDNLIIGEGEFTVIYFHYILYFQIH